jgi:hypothetical protein
MKVRQRVSNVFIISAELNLLLGTSPLFQNGWTRVETKVFTFSVTLRLGERHLYFASGVVRGCRDKTNNQFALITGFWSGGQSPIRASNLSPARIGPTPDGVPVKITSPGIKRSDWLAKETISATE